MIDEIVARNLALIREATLHPGPHMTAITGETGAGKTALLASCRLLTGQRADKSLVREGEAEADVQGRIFLPDGEGEREVVVDRKVSSDGRSRVRINGEMASVAVLSAQVSPYIDICSQHDQLMLSNPSMQRSCLDAWANAGATGVLAEYGEAYRDAVRARSALEAARADSAASDAKVEEARYKLDRIESLDPSRQDYDELVAALRKAENAELLARTSTEAHCALSGEGGALDGLNAAIALLEEGSRADGSLSSLANTLREATYIAEDAALDVARYMDAIELDASMLESMQERLAAYQSLLRSYGPDIEDILDTAQSARAVISAVENASEHVRLAQERVDEAELRLDSAATALSELRAEFAPGLSAAITDVMCRLEMGGAEVVVDVSLLPRESWTESGPDEVRFLFRPAAGMQPRPLSRIASGGELSRVMLALHAVMGERDGVSTLVFDEIDAGVGGSAAVALAEVMSELAQRRQVIVVTHLAQVAARAQVHYVTSKVNDDHGARTQISEVCGDARIEELARMLSGSVTQASMAHASELASGFDGR